MNTNVNHNIVVPGLVEQKATEIELHWRFAGSSVIKCVQAVFGVICNWLVYAWLCVIGK